jgi:glycerol-3-phosphate acyltransferase PlsY
MGLAVLLVDAGKGALAIYIGRQLGASEIVLFTAAFAASAGHIFSPFLGFRGGKGAATVLGISAIMLWQITAVTLVVGMVMFILTKHLVWSVTGMFVLLNVLTIASQPVGPVVLCLILSFLIAFTHLARQRPQLFSALKQGDWRRFMSQD